MVSRERFKSRYACPRCGARTVTARPTDDYDSYCPSCKWEGSLGEDDPEDTGTKYDVTLNLSVSAIHKTLGVLHQEIARIEGNVLLAQRQLTNQENIGGRQRSRAVTTVQEGPYKLAPLVEMHDSLRAALRDQLPGGMR